MPPTDCLDGDDPSAAVTCAPELNRELGPAVRSPMHHGTEPDLSSSMPLPAGVAATGLDLSPEGTVNLDGGRACVSGFQRKKPSNFGTQSVNSSPPSVSTDDCFARAPHSDPKMELRGKRSAFHIGSTTAPHRGCQLGNLKRDAASPEDRVLAARRPLNSPDPPSPLRRRSVKSALQSSRREKCDEGVDAMEAPPGLEPLVLGAARPRSCSASGEISKGSQAIPGVGATSLESRAQRACREKGIAEMMSKAKKAADYIRSLLHAKSCEDNCCKEPGCDGAKQLLAHMRDCSVVRVGECKRSCMQAHRLLEHYAKCSRKRALGGPCCLVCSLVARSSGGEWGTGSVGSACDPKSFGRPIGARSSSMGRTPLCYLSPGPGPSRSGGCGFRDGGGCATVLSSPVGISRLKRGEAGQGPLTGGGRIAVGGPAGMGLRGMGVTMGGRQRNAVFFRPLPKTRSGSWGGDQEELALTTITSARSVHGRGYDRRRPYRRARFDSIPEDLAEEEVEDEEESTPDGGNGSGTGTGSGDSNIESSRVGESSRSSGSKTLVSSHSL